MMTDAFDKELQVGDDVVYAGRLGSTVHFKRGVILALKENNRTVSVKWIEQEKYFRNGSGISGPVSPRNLVKIEK